jgi:hypothetical protein
MKTLIKLFQFGIVFIGILFIILLIIGSFLLMLYLGFRSKTNILLGKFEYLKKKDPELFVFIGFIEFIILFPAFLLLFFTVIGDIYYILETVAIFFEENETLFHKLSRIPTMVLFIAPVIYFFFKLVGEEEEKIFEEEGFTSPILDQAGVLYMGIGAIMINLSLFFPSIPLSKFLDLPFLIILGLGFLEFGMFYAGMWLSGSMGKNLFDILLWHGFLISNGYFLYTYYKTLHILKWL